MKFTSLQFCRLSKRVMAYQMSVIKPTIAYLLQEGTMPYVGYPHNKNLGDEALFLAVSSCFRPKYYLAEYFDTLPWKLAISVQKNDGVFCLGGGSLIFLDSMLAQIESLQNRGLEGFSFGTGAITPNSRDESYISRWRDVISRLSYISVRGNMSADYLRKLNIENVQVIGDPALLFAPDSFDIKKLGVSTGTIAINIRGRQHPSGVEMKMMSQLEQTGQVFLKKGYKLIVVSMSKYEDQLNRELAERLKVNGSVDYVPYQPKWNKHMSIVAECDALIGMRLHFGVLGCCVGVPIILFDGPSKKYADFMQSMELEDYLLPWGEISVDMIVDKLKILIETKKKVSKGIVAKAIHYKRLARDFASKIIKEKE